MFPASQLFGEGCKIKSVKLKLLWTCILFWKNNGFFQLQASVTPGNIVFSMSFAYAVRKPLFWQWFSYTLTEISWYALECLPGASGPSWISHFLDGCLEVLLTVDFLYCFFVDFSFRWPRPRPIWASPGAARRGGEIVENLFVLIIIVKSIGFGFFCVIGEPSVSSSAKRMIVKYF